MVGDFGTALHTVFKLFELHTDTPEDKQTPTPDEHEAPMLNPSSATPLQLLSTLSHNSDVPGLTETELSLQSLLFVVYPKGTLQV